MCNQWIDRGVSAGLFGPHTMISEATFGHIPVGGAIPGLPSNCTGMVTAHFGHGSGPRFLANTLRVCIASQDPNVCSEFVSDSYRCSDFEDRADARRQLERLQQCLGPNQCVRVTAATGVVAGIRGNLFGSYMSVLLAESTRSELTFEITNGSCNITHEDELFLPYEGGGAGQYP